MCPCCRRCERAGAATATEAALNDNTATSAAATSKPPPTATFRSSVDLVALNVVVTDGDQKYVAGLNPSDFAVFEDGIQQDVSFFGASDVPIDLAILLDTSASMTGKMHVVQQAAIGFLETLRPGDRATIVDIKDATKIMFPLGEDLAAAKQAILTTAPRGGTALYNGTYLTLKEMTKDRRANGEVRRQAIVVLSDGDDTASLVSYDDLMDLAKQSGIAIYTITLRSSISCTQAASRGHSYFSQSEFGMKALAQETGARAFFPTAAWRAGGRLCLDRAGAGDTVRHRLRLEEPEARWRLSPRDRPHRRQAGNSDSHARGLHRSAAPAYARRRRRTRPATEGPPLRAN